MTLVVFSCYHFGEENKLMGATLYPDRPDVKTEDLVVLYAAAHLTLREIAETVGMSATGVYRRLSRAGVTHEQGEWVRCACPTCGKPFAQTRKRWREGHRHFCSLKCYYTHLGNSGYTGQHRQSCRIARQTVGRHFKLEPQHIVHHEDRDDRNNDLANLRVFASQAHHMAYHRGVRSVRIAPLWDGRHIVS
jgi:hypothetical protein